MSAAAVNITAPATPGTAAGVSAQGGAGALGAFDALMSAFFGDGAVAPGTAAPAPLAAQPGDPATAAPGPAPGPTAPGAPVPVQTQAQDPVAAIAVSPAREAGPPLPVPPLVPEMTLADSPVDAPDDAPASDDDTPRPSAEADTPAATDGAPVLALISPASPPPPLVAAPADPVEGGGEPASGGQGPAAPPPPAQAAAPDATPDAAPALAEGEARGKAGEARTHTPGAQASDTARVHAAANSAVAAAAQAPSQAAPPRPAPTPHASETARAHAAAPSAVAATPVAAQEPAPAEAVETLPVTAEAAPQPASKPHGRSARAERSLSAPDAKPAPAAPDPDAAAPPPIAAETAAIPAKAAGKEPGPAAMVAAPAPEPKADAAEPAALPADSGRAAASASGAAAAPAPAVRGSPETVANLAAQIVKKLGARSSQFDVQLDPVGLGQVNVRIEIAADGRVSAAMRFDNPQAAAELRARAGELHKALAQSGFDLSGGLSFDVAQDQGGGYSGGQQNPFMNGDNPGHAFRGRAFAAALETAGDAAQTALSGAFSNRSQAPSGVDVRV